MKSIMSEDNIETDKKHLLKLLEKGEHTVYTRMNHVSKSGMTRWIDLFVVVGVNDIRRISWLASDIAGFTYSEKHEGIKVTGCGMDMGFHLVNTLSCRLYCPDKYDHDSAYKLSQRWL